MTIGFDGRVVIVTGAGTGLGRSYALELARRGARVLVNDFGGGVDGNGGSSVPAQRVVEEIRAAGGEAIANGADVTNEEHVAEMVAQAMGEWGRIDGLINNAGILRDAAFHKMTLADFRKVVDVHLMGSVVCTHAIWPIMRAARYGRIVFTTSTSGLYGNFGQANYGAAKMALVGLMNVLVLEGARFDIRINAISPGAATRMTEALLPPSVVALMTPDAVAPAAVYLVSDSAPNGTIINANSGGFSRTYLRETIGIHLGEVERSADGVAAHFEQISDPNGEQVYPDSGPQVMKFVARAAAAAGVDLQAPATET